LEAAAAAATLMLQRLPETQPVAQVLASRSAGIKDLRHGELRATDRAGIDDTDARQDEPLESAPLLQTAVHYYIGATLTRDPGGVVAATIGDGLVPFPSASGSGARRDLGLDPRYGRHLDGLHHLNLLNHPKVWVQLRDWLVEQP
jgi:hypothetical protein